MPDVKKINNKVLSLGGRAEVGNIMVPPYPKLMHFKKENLDKEFIAEYKINGANIRLVYLPEIDDFVAVLRGGLLDQKMTNASHKYKDLFLKFLKENPSLILCTEMLGTETIANNNPEYFEKFGFTKKFVYFVFDIMDMNTGYMLPFEEKKRLCEKYNLQMIPVLGRYNKGEFEKMVEDIRNFDEVYEGLVLKTPDGKEIYKFRFDANRDLYPEREIKDKRKLYVEPDEKKIVGHFMQGYEEKELGLESGITKEEFDKYQEFLEKMSQEVTRENVGEKVKEIVDFLMTTINKHGTFKEEMQKKIEKSFRSMIGKKVARFVAKK